MPYVCPVKKELCKTAEVITIPNTIPSVTALAYDNLASGSAVLAITAGRYNSGVSVDKDGNKTAVLTILDDVKNVEVDYQFKGIAYTPMGSGRGHVKPGDTIGWVSNQKLDKGLSTKQYSLMVSVQDLKTKTFINLDITELLKNTR